MEKQFSRIRVIRYSSRHFPTQFWNLETDLLRNQNVSPWANKIIRASNSENLILNYRFESIDRFQLQSVFFFLEIRLKERQSTEWGAGQVFWHRAWLSSISSGSWEGQRWLWKKHQPRLWIFNIITICWILWRSTIPCLKRERTLTSPNIRGYPSTTLVLESVGSIPMTTRWEYHNLLKSPYVKQFKKSQEAQWFSNFYKIYDR